MVSSVLAYELGSVVYEPFLGLCTVVDSSEETMLGVQQLFYQLRPQQGTSVVKVPAAQMASRGIRPLMSAERVRCALESAAGAVGEPVKENYAQRMRRWTQLLRSGQEASGYDFLREWHHLSAQGARLSFKESEVFENVQRNMIQEIAEVLQIPSEEAGLRLSGWLKQGEVKPLS